MHMVASCKGPQKSEWSEQSLVELRDDVAVQPMELERTLLLPAFHHNPADNGDRDEQSSVLHRSQISPRVAREPAIDIGMMIDGFCDRTSEVAEHNAGTPRSCGN
jgi:hypothetical protein